MKTKVEQTREKFAAELAKAEREDALLAILPVEPKHVCIHNDSASVTYEGGSYKPLSFADAMELYGKFKPSIVEGEHWSDGCVSTNPEAINSNAKKESAHMDGSHVAEIRLESFGSRGEYQQCSLNFWVKLGDAYAEISVRCQPEWKWFPQREVSYDSHGRVSRCQITPQALGEDKRRKWSSEPPGYRISYYWADVIGFEGWAANYLPQPATA